MSNLRKEFIKEWRVWYSMRYKAHRAGVEFKKEWDTFEGWLDEVGPRPGDNYQFCRDKSPEDNHEPWNETTAGWRAMPAGRNHSYRNYYTTSRIVLDKIAQSSDE